MEDYLRERLGHLAMVISRVQGVAQSDDDEMYFHSHGIEYSNDTFQMHPYCWCDRRDCPWCSVNDGPDENEYGADHGSTAPNFWHKKSGFKLWWYKYPGRGMEYNKDLTYREIDAIVQDCIDSLGS